MALAAGVPGGMERYRQTLAQSFFAKFFFHVSGLIDQADISDYREISMRKMMATQTFADVPSDQAPWDPLGRPIMHQSGETHTTGEARYCDDIQVSDVLHLALVLSSKARARIISIDSENVLKMDGIICVLDYRNVPKSNSIGIALTDTPVFAEHETNYFGQPIAAVIGVDPETTRIAASKVKIEYEELKPIVTIEEAVAADSYLKFSPLQIHSSLLDNRELVDFDWTKCDYILNGSVKIGGQEHFYLEPQGCIAVPGEVDHIEIVSSSQNIDDIQKNVSNVLGIARHKVLVRVKRIGGGFGGKESAGTIYACPTAIAAMKLRRPVKCTVERVDDMVTSGQRHPFRVDYKVAVSKNGQLLALSAQLFSNCGHTLDLSKGVMERAICHLDNVYRWGNVDIFGHLCRTNLQSMTAFRGFGAPQAMLATETIMIHIAERFCFDVDLLREQNLYKEGDRTPFGMTLNQCNIQRCWTECKIMTNYQQRKVAVNKFNALHTYKKRGISLVPTKFGIGFGYKPLNQAGCLVHVYLDGSVLISHGGMEMGQGLHTKILQIATRCLAVPAASVHIEETATDKVPNSSPTAASVGSDIYGLAVQDACHKLNERLAPYKESNTNGTFVQWVNEAYNDRISLSATGYAIIHSETVDYEKGRGANLWGYAVYGVGCSEVEIDCLSGDHRLLRTDIVMDVGDSLNPAVDIGQIEGAFVQGYGMFTMEELKVRPNGMWLSRGPGVYKIPSADDAPRQFHVKLLRGSSNKMGIFSSKAVGEPPLFLGSSAFFAIRSAIKSYREQNGFSSAVGEYFRFDSPATAENIRMSCEDAFTRNVASLPSDDTFTPWTVTL